MERGRAAPALDGFPLLPSGRRAGDEGASASSETADALTPDPSPEREKAQRALLTRDARAGDRPSGVGCLQVRGRRWASAGEATEQTPNSDTPYSALGMDLRAEPRVLTVPCRSFWARRPRPRRASRLLFKTNGMENLARSNRKRLHDSPSSPPCQCPAPPDGPSPALAVRCRSDLIDAGRRTLTALKSSESGCREGGSHTPGWA